ncbi:hypothetical protein BDW75DRAFT_199839 [Aspergillus navahoensis]
MSFPQLSQPRAGTASPISSYPRKARLAALRSDNLVYFSCRRLYPPFVHWALLLLTLAYRPETSIHSYSRPRRYTPMRLPESHPLLWLTSQPRSVHFGEPLVIR